MCCVRVLRDSEWSTRAGAGSGPNCSEGSGAFPRLPAVAVGPGLLLAALSVCSDEARWLLVLSEVYLVLFDFLYLIVLFG